MAETHTPFECDDIETAELILNLQLEDVEYLRSSSKDKNPAGQLDDSQLALSLLEQDLECIRSIISDRVMTRSIADAVQSDGPLIADVIREEEQACEAYTLAHRMNGSDVVSEVSLQASLNEDILSKLAGQYMSEDVGREFYTSFKQTERSDSEADFGVESSNRASNRHVHAHSRELFCVACHETKKYFDVIEAHCGHGYCKPCLQELVDLSTKDESLFPPRCCRRPLIMTEVQIFLTKELKDKFEQAKVEFSTADRTYCSQTTCSAFIPAAETVEGDSVTCWDCGTATCVICKAGAHEGDCPDDSALRETLALATESGWQRCYSCRRLIELEVGCNHMSCRCGAEFCYVCGVSWKECACDQWNEDRLLHRANILVDRDVPHMAANNPVRIERVANATEMLRDRHNCTHTSWRYISGSHNCEECFHTLPNYIFECRQCRVQACNRCRRNRL